MGSVLKRNATKKTFEGKTLILIFFLKLWGRAVMREKKTSPVI